MWNEENHMKISMNFIVYGQLFRLYYSHGLTRDTNLIGMTIIDIKQTKPQVFF